MMDTSRASLSIDWLSFTFHWNSAALAPISHIFDPERIALYVTGHQGRWIAEKPCNGYPYVVSAADRPGLRVMAAEPNSPMGVHVSWSGSALRQVEPRAVLRNALTLGGVCRRLDIAFDIPMKLNFEDAYDAIKTKRANYSARKYSRIESDSGSTIYVGSRTSEQMLRIYDKAAESNLDYDLTRFELENKGDQAKHLAIYIDLHDLEGMQDVIHGFCNFPHLPDLELWFTSPTLSLGIPKQEKVRDTRRWLMEIVAPSLGRIAAEDHNFYVQFIRKVITIAGVDGRVGEADPFEGAADWDPTGPHTIR